MHAHNCGCCHFLVVKGFMIGVRFDPITVSLFENAFIFHICLGPLIGDLENIRSFLGKFIAAVRNFVYRLLFGAWVARRSAR